MITSAVMLIGGLLLLIKGADYLVEGASSIAMRFGISGLVIGLTVVAFGTSAPELVVNLIAAFTGNTDLALGNVNGSNIANILLILGITSLLTTIPVKSRTVIKEIPFMILSGAMLIILMLDAPLEGGVSGLSRIDGLVLLGFFSIFMYYLVLSTRGTKGGATVEKTHLKLVTALLMTAGGLFALVFGGKLTVDGATAIALSMGISEGLIAATVVAVGTSLPELVTSIVAARKGKTDVAVGGIVGSNIFNIMMILGLTATISPNFMAVTSQGIWDATMALGAMIVLLVALFAGGKQTEDSDLTLSKKEGLVFVALYLVYLVFIVIRG
ncbi:sodium:proton exchanger [Candidatus Uhrbacteria bacterium CG_4_10_14_0_2_um_filter_41_7]|uniref:Sodium:proton exchanger n=1 Tax=Candidatus Uhrbacteria bacterium CG_4_9_14_3_um_filter_41_35 TaxID=1975034 RepID=A0A2M7XF14_9BACT|nr:MAG: sodium:proton exchanger [Candidatus Uhrbacteria bacterium CG_4_10_14_0_2_um_filter_41_7]PJA46448.1 MAG: sodium:proton exchanger [Candidatus Uhrbacteria bacterium CG_4_9_14_3_um_filter_41_35]